MKHIKNFRPLVLAAILVVTSAAAAVCGLVMKGQLQKYVGGYDDKWAIAGTGTRTGPGTGTRA